MIRSTSRVAALALLAALLALAQSDPAAAANVNSRYVIEGVHYPAKVTGPLRNDIDKLVGAHYDEAVAKELAGRIRRELNAASVTHRIERGDKPDHVKLFFESSGRRFEQAADITKLAYHSKHGWTGGVEAGFDIRQLRLGAGVQSDADTLLERYAGYNLNISRTIADRVRLRFDFEDYHQIWNGTTRWAEGSNASASGIYRERRAFRPTVSVLLARGLTYTTGIDIQHMEMQHPAVRTEAANSVINTLRLRRTLETSGSSQHLVEAGYSLRTATRTLDSDFVYTRHAADAHYGWRLGEHHVDVRAGGGRMGGRAPLFERFAPGNTRTLRGWNRFDLAPLGGSRTAVGGVEYRYDHVLIFYDTGAVWDPGQPRVVRHSAGAGFAGSGWFLAVAFPIRSTGVQPVFLVGTGF